MPKLLTLRHNSGPLCHPRGAFSIDPNRAQSEPPSGQPSTLVAAVRSHGEADIGADPNQGSALEPMQSYTLAFIALTFHPRRRGAAQGWALPGPVFSNSNKRFAGYIPAVEEYGREVVAAARHGAAL